MSDHRTDVVIHIDENLADEAIHTIEQDLSSQPGVFSACVNDRARHLLLVDYDPKDVKAVELLGRVRDHGVGAELVGL
jgi:16S rRNA G1207 methylase RsmC